MTSLERRRNRVNEALTEADEILKRQQESHFRLKTSKTFESIFALGDNGRLLTESELHVGPAGLKEAWASMAADRLLRIALYYRLLFSDEILSSDESSAYEAALRSHLEEMKRRFEKRDYSPTSEKSLALDVYHMTEADWENVEQGVRWGAPEETPEDAFAEALEVYARRMEELYPKRAARLRRAIRAGCHDLDVEGGENWPPWMWMAYRRDFDAINLKLDDENPRPDDKDRRLRRSQALGEGIGRGIANALADFATSSDDGRASGVETAKRLFEFAPIVNVRALPTFGEFAFMCAAGTLIVCMVLIGFRLLRLL